MNIQFEYEEFNEEDSSWGALFVKIDDGAWHLAQSAYNTEDKDMIKKIISDQYKS
jgi:hypothetical protein